MADDDGLEARLRAAIGAVPEGSPPAGARGDLVAGLRRHRTRRRHVAVGALAGALVAAVVANGLTGISRPLRSAGHAAHVPAATSTSVGSPSTKVFGTAANPPCVMVGVGAAPAGCAGTYTQPPTATRTSADNADRASTLAASASASAPAYAAAGALSPQELVVGESLTIEIPADQGLAWAPPRIERSTAAESAKPVLEVVRSSGGKPGQKATATVRAVHPGVADIVARAEKACGAGHGPCGQAEQVWTLQVMVEGT